MSLIAQQHEAASSGSVFFLELRAVYRLFSLKPSGREQRGAPSPGSGVQARGLPGLRKVRRCFSQTRSKDLLRAGRGGNADVLCLRTG